MKLRLLFIALLVSGFSWGQIIYQDNFGTTAIAAKPYTGTPTTADPNLNTFSWTTSAAIFGSLAGNGGAPSQSLSLTNSSGTPTMTFTFNVAAGYELSVSQFNFWRVRSGTGAQNWSLTINGTNVGTGTIPTTGATLGATNVSTPISALTGTITVVMTYSGATGSGTCRLDDFTLYGTVSSTAPCSTPATQASTLTSNNVTTTGANLSWTDGASTSGTLVSLKLKASALVAPSSSTNYTPTLNFSTAAGANLINANNVVVAKNNTGTVTGITGLTAGTQYTATPYAYNGGGANVCFNNTNPESFDFWTLATEPASHGAFTTCGASTVASIVVNFTAASLIPASGYLLIYRQGAAPTGVPVDGTIYAPGSTIGDATVFSYIAPGAVNTNVTGLNGGSTYFFALIPYNAVAGPVFETINYRTAATIPTLSCSTSPAPEINVRGVVGANPTITDGDTTPTGLDNTLWGTVVVGNSFIKTFRIENTGNANLTISNITMVGGNPGDFTIPVISFPFTILPGAFYDLAVTFSPTAAGTRNTTLTIANTDSNENPYDFVIQGTGTLVAAVEINVKGNGQSIPDNSIYPQGTNWTAFGLATVGVTTVTRTFTIENLGSTSLFLTGTPYVTVTGPHASMFIVTVQPSTGTIAGSASVTFDITFNPTSPGAKNATVVIANNDTDENPYNFNISGTAKGINNIYVYGNGNDVNKGDLTTSTTNLTNFGSVAVTTGVKQNTFVITNLSGISTYYSTITISGADAAMFTAIAQPTNNALGSGNSTSFTINFTPTSIGAKNATLTFNVYTDSGRTVPEPMDPVYTFAISGEGIIYTPCTNNSVQTIAIQDFEAVPATPTYGYSYTTDGAVTIAGGTYNNGSGAKNAFIDAQSFQMAGIGTAITRTSVISMAPIDVSQYNNINLSLKVGAFRTGTTQGVDINELIQVETSIDNGVNWSTEAVLRGYSNSRWDFNASGVFNAYYTGTNNGATIDTRNGNAELANGIATYYVKNLPASSNLLVRLTLAVDRSDEIWAIDNIKIEGQTAVATTWNGSAWTAGFPTPSIKAIFDGDYTTTAAFEHGSIQACECQVKATRNVTVDSGYNFEIQSNVTNAGNLTIANNGSLVQINDAATNTGNIIYQRTPTGIRGFDYIYWSSPVMGQSIDNLYSSPTPGVKYKWNPLATNINSPVSSGIWQSMSGTMDVGSGYIVRGSSNYGMAASSIPAVFTGQPNNGIIPVSISRGNNTTASTPGPGNGVVVTNFDDNWNLVGNPFPSSIKALDFLTYNSNIQGFVYLWTHGTAPVSSVNPFYSWFLYNYTTTDYITYNGTATTSGPTGFNGYIAGGQGFFVLMNDGAAANGTVTFKNSMRNKTYANNQFYRTTQAGDDSDKHRIWLDLLDSNNVVNRTVIGYVPEATNGLDRLFDAYKNMANERNIYSLSENQTLIIQGRSLPFDSSDQVPVGVRIMQDGDYKIAIGVVDGLFLDETQNIYLEDKVLGVIYDLRQNPYSFTATAGIINDRFVLRYNNNTLNTPEFGSVNEVILTSNHGQMGIKSSVEAIQDVTVYDILGRQLFDAKAIGSKNFTAANIATQQALIVKIKLANGTIVTRKIIL